MLSTANMLLSKLCALQERQKNEDEEQKRHMEEAEEQEAEWRHEKERKAVEVEELWRAKAGMKRKAMGSVNEDGSEAPEGFAKGKPCYLCQKVEVICYWPDK